MKNTFRFMAVLATVAAALASCVKAEIDSPAEEDANTENVYQGPVKTLTFTAQTSTPQVKTSLGDVVTDGNGNKTQPVLWAEDDQIKILYVVDGTEYSVTATPTSVNGSSAEFTAEVPESGVENFYAVYPATTKSTITMGDSETGEIKVTIPTTTGTFKKANIMVAKCAATAPVLKFKHACSIVKFTTGDVAPKAVYFYSGSRTANRGYTYVTFDSSNAILTTSTASETNKYSSITASEPNTDYYMALWPDHTLKDGFIIAFRDDDFIQTEEGWRVAYHPNDVTLARGGILDLGVIQDKIRTDYFVASTAKGRKDGSSWDNACDITYVRNMFAKQADNDYAYAQQMKLENTNFWFAGDATFVFGTDEAPRMDMCFAGANKSNRCPINFYGGCTGTTGTDKTRDPEGHPTVFSGDGKYALFSVRNKTTLTLDGITLANTRAKTANTKDGLFGGALHAGYQESDEYYQYFIKVDDVVDFNSNAPRININNCIFIDNKEESGLDGSLGGGAAINLLAGNVYVNNTLFKNNSSEGSRPCIHAVSDTQTNYAKRIYFNSCRFTGNTMASNYGSVIRIRTTKTLFAMNGCTFAKNDCSGAQSQVSFNNSYIFTNNTMIEDASLFSTKGAGILRKAYSNNGTEGVLANNIILDCSTDADEVSVYYYEKTVTFKALANYTGVFKEANSTNHTNSDLAGGDSYLASSRTGLKPSNFDGLSYSTDTNLWTWTGTVTGVDNWSFTSATAEQMVAATKANSKIGDDFYNWLVEIGAIVDGQFTDCRGYLRPADAMCPGAYDPNATQPTL